MNYQGVLARRDVAGALCVMWYLVTFHPMLSLGLVGCVVAACCWESSVKGGRVVVNMFRGKVSRGSGLPSATGGGNYGHNLVMTQTTVEGGEQQQHQQQQAGSANKDHTEIHIP